MKIEPKTTKKAKSSTAFEHRWQVQRDREKVDREFDKFSENQWLQSVAERRVADHLQLQNSSFLPLQLMHYHCTRRSTKTNMIARSIWRWKIKREYVERWARTYRHLRWEEDSEGDFSLGGKLRVKEWGDEGFFELVVLVAEGVPWAALYSTEAESHMETV